MGQNPIVETVDRHGAACSLGPPCFPSGSLFNQSFHGGFSWLEDSCIAIFSWQLIVCRGSLNPDVSIELITLSPLLNLRKLLVSKIRTL